MIDVNVLLKKLKTDFAVGDKVIIRPGTRYCREGDRTNPRATEGVIYEINPLNGLPITVEWANGFANCYASEDLGHA